MHASEGRYSYEIDVLGKIDRFGVEAVTGRRVLSFGEIRRMIIAENIVAAYRSSLQNNNWAEWTEKNPTAAALLVESMKLCQTK